jgi:hypothetical protein
MIRLAPKLRKLHAHGNIAGLITGTDPLADDRYNLRFGRPAWENITALKIMGNRNCQGT